MVGAVVGVYGHDVGWFVVVAYGGEDVRGEEKEG